MTVPAWSVVYYPQRLLERQQENRDDHYDLRACVLHTKQSSVQDSEAWTSPSAAVLRETGEEALPPSAPTAVWGASPVLKPAQLLVKQETARG